jgi:hypothetical protein
LPELVLGFMAITAYLNQQNLSQHYNRQKPSALGVRKILNREYTMTSQEEQEEHDAMMRSFHGVPVAHKLETMSDIDLAELQSHMPPNSPGKIIIDNEWQRRILSKVTSKAPKITRKSQNTIQKIKHWYKGNEVELIPIKNGNFVDIYARYEKSTSARVANGLVKNNRVRS